MNQRRKSQSLSGGLTCSDPGHGLRLEILKYMTAEEITRAAIYYPLYWNTKELRPRQCANQCTIWHRRKAPSASDVGRGSVEGTPEPGQGFIHESVPKHRSGALSKMQQTSMVAKGGQGRSHVHSVKGCRIHGTHCRCKWTKHSNSSKYHGDASLGLIAPGHGFMKAVLHTGAAEKAKKGSSQAKQRPAKVGAAPSLGPGTPLLPARPGRPQGFQTPRDIQEAPTETASAEMEALSSAAAAFEAQKQSLRQSRMPSAKAQGPKQNSHAAATSDQVQADDLVKMVVGAALSGQQPGTLKGQSTQDLQNHLMGSFFAGPGFQLPPTPEALPLPSSSLLQRLGQQ